MFEVPVVLLEPYPKGAARLSDIFHAAIGPCESVNPAVIKHVVGVVYWFLAEYSCNGVVGGESDSDWEVPEQFRDIFGFSPYVRKLCPSAWVCIILSILIILFFCALMYVVVYVLGIVFISHDLFYCVNIRALWRLF